MWKSEPSWSMKLRGSCRPYACGGVVYPRLRREGILATIREWNIEDIAKHRSTLLQHVPDTAVDQVQIVFLSGRFATTSVEESAE